MLVDDSTSHLPPTREQIEAWNLAREKQIAVELEDKERTRLENARIATSASNATEGGRDSQKRKDREARRKAKQPTQDDLFAEEEQPSSAGQQQSAPSKQTEKSVYTVSIPAESSSLAWYDPRTYETIEDAKDAGIWDYPSTPMERARCGVFEDLAKKGYFMGPGLKFGGAFLVYPGQSVSPLQYACIVHLFFS